MKKKHNEMKEKGQLVPPFVSEKSLLYFLECKTLAKNLSSRKISSYCVDDGALNLRRETLVLH